jgi:hypothetical protein
MLQPRPFYIIAYSSASTFQVNWNSVLVGGESGGPPCVMLRAESSKSDKPNQLHLLAPGSTT